MGEFSKQHETTNRGPKEAKQTDPKPQMQQIENPKLNFNSNKLFQVNVFSLWVIADLVNPVEARPSW